MLNDAGRSHSLVIVTRRPGCATMCVSTIAEWRKTLEESMIDRFRKAAGPCAVAFVCLVAVAQAQTAAPAAPAASTVVDHPTYVSIPLEMNVNRPAAEVWKRV